MPVNAFVLLRTEGVAAVIDLTDGRLPSIPYWGADLGELSESEVRSDRAVERVPDGRPTSSTTRSGSRCSPSTGRAGWADPV